MRISSLLYGLLLSCCACGSEGERSSQREQVRHVVYWEKWTDFEGESMGRVVQAFNAAQRDRTKLDHDYRPIQVEMVSISQIEQKLLIACAGGNPPDVAGLITSMIPVYADKGALVDLTELAQAASIERSNYIEHYYDLGVFRGRLWGLPTAPAAVALHWNKRLFQEAGLDPERAPSTLEELDAFAEKLTRWEVTLPNGEKQVQVGYLSNVPEDRKRLLQVGFMPTEPNWWNFGWGFVFGGKLIDGDRVTATAPENIRAYEWVASYSHKLGVSAIQRFRSSSGAFASVENPFLSGRIAMQQQGVWMHNFIDKLAGGMQWGAAPFPAPASRPGGAGASDIESDTIVIPVGSKHGAEAWEFVQYVQTQAAMEELCLGQRKHSPLKEPSEQFYARHDHPYVRLFADIGAGPNAYWAPQIPVWNEYLREMVTAADKIQNLNATPRQALEELEAPIQLALDRNRAISRRRNP
jgi:multiple sugar transport system substrate-binding protein